VGCFNFEREEVLIFKLFGRWFKPIGWDGDIRKLRKRLTKVYSFFCSEPTAWDGNLFSAGRTFTPTLCSKPTVWDGDKSVANGFHLARVQEINFHKKFIWCFLK
jgi:hypothetical protein